MSAIPPYMYHKKELQIYIDGRICFADGKEMLYVPVLPMSGLVVTEKAEMFRVLVGKKEQQDIWIPKSIMEDCNNNPSKKNWYIRLPVWFIEKHKITTAVSKMKIEN